MRKMNIVFSAILLTAVAFALLCGPAFAETASVSTTEAKYGFRFNAKGDAVTFKKGDTLKAVVTDTTKLETQLKTSPAPAKGTALTLIYKGNREFSMQWKSDGKMCAGRMIVSPGSFE
jgi:hypothetical protein